MGSDVLRLIQVAHGWPPARLGGVELYARTVQQALRQLGHHCSSFVAAPQAGTSSDGLQVLGPHPDPRSFRDGYLRPDVEERFREWLAVQRPHLVHLHHLAHLSTGLARVASEAGAAVVMTLHDYWLVCARGQLVDNTGRRCAGPTERRCTPCLAGQLALDPGSAPLRSLVPGLPEALRVQLRELLGRLKGSALQQQVVERRRLVAAALTRVQRFASPSHHLADRVGALGVPRDRIDLVPLPLVQPVRPAPMPGAGPLRLLFLGSLIPTKGAHLLVEAFASLPAGAATLRVVGPRPRPDLDPHYGDRLADRISQLPGARLEAAFAPGGVQPFLDEADVLVAPSSWEENSPLVVREALAAGLRVVASRIGGIPEIAPGARWFQVGEESDLRRALVEELRIGRARNAPAQWPTPTEHAEALVAWYRRALCG